MEKYVDVAEKIGTFSALTQESGDIIYSEIIDCFEKKEKIYLDFSNVESMISPFLNRSIGKLYEKYTGEFIKQYLIMQNFPQNKVSTLNIVISNAKKYYANKEEYMNIAKDVVDLG